MILTLSGGSAVGKSAVFAALRARHQIELVPSYTTCIPRPDHLSGEYRYISKEEFERSVERGDFAWTRGHRGRLYGTRRGDLTTALESDSLSVMILLPNVLLNLRSEAHVSGMLERVRSVHLWADPYEVKRRLTEVRDMSAVQLMHELNLADVICRECFQMGELFDLVIKNEDGKLEKTLARIEGLINV